MIDGASGKNGQGMPGMYADDYLNENSVLWGQPSTYVVLPKKRGEKWQ